MVWKSQGWVKHLATWSNLEEIFLKFSEWCMKQFHSLSSLNLHYTADEWIFFMMNEFKQNIFKALNRENIGDCIDKENGWVKNPFTSQLIFSSFFSTKLKAVLIELSAERSLTVILYYRLLYNFWHIIWKEFKELNDISITKLLLFSFCYLCELLFLQIDI